MYRLEAFAPRDGWAIASEGDELFLLRPPYLRRDRQPLTPEDVRRALGQEGLEVRDASFGSLGALVRALVAEREALARAADPERAGEAARRLLQRAEPSDLDALLDTIEARWLDQGRWREAERALTALLTVPALADRSDLMPRLQALLRRTQALRDRPPVTATARRSWTEGVTGTADVAAGIAERRAVLPLAA